MFSFVKNRPPLVVFFLCAVTLTVTISCFAFYIKNTDPVPDSDKNHDWLTLLKHFNSLEACIDLDHSAVKGKTPNEYYVEMTRVQTLISINSTDFVKKLNGVRGYLTLTDWHSNCPKNNGVPKDLGIYFEVPKALKANETKYDICVTIEGPEELLPRFSEPNCKAPTETSSEKVAYLSTSVRRDRDDGFCKTGSLVKLNFQRQTKDNLADFLSDAEKSVIYYHLMWTSYVLLFLLLIIVIYGTLQSDYFYDSLLHKWMPFQK